jgi:hypothetical protein
MIGQILEACKQLTMIATSKSARMHHDVIALKPDLEKEFAA